jgi:CSLREA domain-containing protein
MLWKFLYRPRQAAPGTASRGTAPRPSPRPQSGDRRRARPGRRPTGWLQLEELETRLAPAVLTVNTLADQTTADNFLSLREALGVVNAGSTAGLSAAERAQVSGTLGSNDTVQFDPGLAGGTITLTGGALSITRAVAINGPGAGLLTVNGNGLDRVFIVGHIYSRNLSLNAALSGLTITGGSALSGSNNYGAGLLNFGTLSLNAVTFSGNAAGSSGGGGVYNVGSLTATGCAFTGNNVASGGAGAGILNSSSGTLTVTSCTFTSNSATSGGSGAGIANSGNASVSSSTFANNTVASNGAGIHNSSTGTLTITSCTFTNGNAVSDGGAFDNDGTVTVSSSTFSNNTCGSEGGAIDNHGSAPKIINSTFVNNTASSRGGAINGGGAVTLINCTLTGNRVTSSSGQGGGLLATAPAQLFNTIVAGNFRGAAPGTTANDIGGTVDAGSAFNLIGTGGGGGLANGSGGNQVGVSNPGLGGLASNGGPTQTVALLPGSPAIDRGSNAYVTAGETDQRGLTRVVNGTVDIGAFEVQAGAAATSFTVTGFPSTATAGVAGTFAVTARDAGGNPVTSYLGTVRFASSDPQAVLPANYTFTSADNGVHTFTATLNTTGTRSLTVTDTASPNITGAQAGIQVTPATASSLVVAGFLSPTTAGAAGTFTVTARDAFGNIATGYTGTVTLTSSDSQAALAPASYTFTAGDAGVHTFSATLKTAGTQSITASDAANSLSASRSGIVVTPAAASSLVVSGYPTPTTAGVAHAFTVTAKDPFGNTATGYTGTVTLGSSDSQAALAPASYTFTAGDAGVHTFSGTLNTAGTQSITASDAANSLSASQAGIQVTPAPLSLVLTGYPSPTTAGAAQTFTVTVKDSFGNTAAGYTGTVTLTSSDSQATFAPASHTFTAGDAGVFTFSVTLKTAGTQSITATDAANGVSASQTGIQVTPAAASSLIVAGYPTPTTAGVAHTFTVTAKDSFGNTATGYTGTVTLTSGDSQATFTPASYSFNAGDAGVHTFSATLKTAGTQSISATDAANSLSASQAGIQVTQAAASSLVVSGYPSPTTAGVAHAFTLTAKDSFGNTATGYTGTVTLTSSDSQAAFAPASYTFTAGDAGVHTFSGTLKTAGTQLITATDAANSLGGSETNIVVKPAAASSLVVSGYPTPTTAGVAHAFTVTAKDPFGNTATGYTGAVALTSSDSQAAFTPAGYTFTAGDAGMHTFSGTLNTAGTQSITVTDTTTASITGTQSGIVVNTATNGAVLTVNSVADNTTANAVLTLREAIQYVDGTLGRALTAGEQAQVSGTLGTNNVIQFNLPAGPQTITLSGGALSITRAVAINGPGAGLLTVNGNGLDRVFIVGRIWSRDLSLSAALSGLTIAGGSALSGSNNYGAGLLNFGTLALNAVTFSGNAAGSSGGGGVYNVGSLTVSNSAFTGNSVTNVGAGAGILNNSSGTLTVTNCTFTSNSGTAGSSGGGISNSGTASVSGCTFANNTVASNGAGISNSSTGNLTITNCTFTNGSAASDGGGLDSDGTLTATGCTFANNTAGSEGGAIDNHGSAPKVLNCTFAGNTAQSRGGAINASGALQLVNCTLTGNRVTSSSGSGGGVLATAPAQLFNTVVAGNFRGPAPGTTANDIGGTVDAGSAFNLIGTGGSGGLSNGSGGNQVGVSNPGLGGLASNGGPTQTVALLPGSPAIDRGGNANVTAGETDQRGFTRIVNGTVDIGAFEVQLTTTPPADQGGTAGVATALTLGSFADANGAAGPWAVAVDWGDGSTATTFTANVPGSLGTQTHTYQATGVFTVTVTITDANHDAGRLVFHSSMTAPTNSAATAIDNSGAASKNTLSTRSGKSSVRPRHHRPSVHHPQRHRHGDAGPRFDPV